MIGFCSTSQFVEHYTGPYHPERSDRIRAIYAALTQAGLLDSPNPFPDFEIDLGELPPAGEKLLEIPFAAATTEDLLTVHTKRLVDYVGRVCTLGGGVLDEGDTPVGPDSFDVALLAVGAVLHSCDAVMAGRVRRCFAAVRPPGHHAEPDRPMGFCLFSNVAIAARYLQRKHNLSRIAIVDFDVHHGNGTQACFEEDPSIFFASLHEHPASCYPGSGYDWEIGMGRGRGYTLNIPLNPGCGDEEYLRVLDLRVLPELEEFRPEFLLISAGFDGHAEDPLAQMQLTELGYELMTRSLAAAADRHCAGRVVSVLEGGYNLRALGRSVVRHIIGLQS